MCPPLFPVAALLASALVAVVASSVVWSLVLRRRVTAAYERGHFAGSFDSFPEHFEAGRLHERKRFLESLDALRSSGCL